MPGKSKTFEERKKGLGGSWKAAQQAVAEEKDDFVPVNDGPYEVQLAYGKVGDFGGEDKLHEKVVVVSGDDEGAILQEFQRIGDEQGMQFMLRRLKRMGQDVSELTIESNDDLEALYAEMIEERLTGHVKVKRNDQGYAHVNWIRPDDDIEAVDLNDVDGIDGSVNRGRNGNVKDAAEESASEPEATEAKAEGDLEVGQAVYGKVDGDWYPGKVQSVEEDGVEVKFDDDDEVLVLKAEDVAPPEDFEEEEGGEESGEKEEEEESGADGLKKDDRVIVTYRRKMRPGVVARVDGEDVDVKMDFNGKTETFKADVVAADVKD